MNWKYLFFKLTQPFLFVVYTALIALNHLNTKPANLAFKLGGLSCRVYNHDNCSSFVVRHFSVALHFRQMLPPSELVALATLSTGSSANLAALSIVSMIVFSLIWAACHPWPVSHHWHYGQSQLLFNIGTGRHKSAQLNNTLKSLNVDLGEP